AGGVVPRHRKFQDVRHGDAADRWRAWLHHRACFDHSQAPGLRGLSNRLFLGLRHHSLRDCLWIGQHLCEGPQQGEAEMTSLAAAAHSVVEPSRLTKRVAGSIVVFYALISMVPPMWLFATGWKTPPDSIA